MRIEKIILSLSAMTLLATRYRNRLIAVDALPDNEDDDAAIDRAWQLFEDARLEQQIANAPESNDETPDEWDDSDGEDARDQRDYEDGKAQAEMRRAERRIYGSAVANEFHAQDDINAFNRGDD